MNATFRLRAGLAAGAFALSTTALLAACGSSGSESSATTTTARDATTTAPSSETTTASGGSTTTTTAATGETTTTLSSEGVDTVATELDTLPDGDHYGYIAGLEQGTVEGQAVDVLIWDEVEFLTGQAAIDAAAEDDATLDTDYYIRNENQTVRRIAVVPDASVTTLEEGSSGSKPSAVGEVWRQEYLFKINVGNVRDITTISSIDAVYLP